MLCVKLPLFSDPITFGSVALDRVSANLAWVPRARTSNTSRVFMSSPKAIPPGYLTPLWTAEGISHLYKSFKCWLCHKGYKPLHHIFSGRVTMATTITCSCSHDGENLRVINPRMDGTTVWVHNIIHDCKVCTVEVSSTYRFSVAMEIRYCHVSLRWCKPVTQLSLINAHQKLTPKAVTVVSICQSYIRDHEWVYIFIRRVFIRPLEFIVRKSYYLV